MLPTTQSISKKTKGPSTRTDTTTKQAIGIGTLKNVVVMVGLVLLSYSQIYNSSIMIAYVPESQSVPNTPLQLEELQLDMMVPVFQRDDRIRAFAASLGKAIVDYKQNANNDGTPQISTFRLLVTRFSSDETSEPNSSADFQSELAALAFLPRNDIVMVHAPSGQAFSRSVARNLLHDNACPLDLDTCLATAMDVDMEIRQEFFQHAVQMVFLMQDEENVSEEFPTPSKQQADRQIVLHKNTSVPTVYFPVMWSEYNPKSIQLVETFKRQKKHQPNYTLDEFSEHRGKWYPHGTGMYVMRGSDIRSFRFDETFQGWGFEDWVFYFQIGQHRRILRRHETGNIHIWHGKSCVMGKDVFLKEQAEACEGARNFLQGSNLGKKLLESKSKKRRESSDSIAYR
jgi:hypothetical protein